MTTTFTAYSLQKQIRRDTKHKIFAIVEEDSVGTTKRFKSEVWKTFKLVKVVASGFIIANLCCCHKCKSVLSYNKKSGTSHLKRHVDACITRKVTGAMNQYLNKTVTLTNAEKDSLKLLQMKHVVLGHHSFNSTEEPGLVALLQGMVDLGSKHGKFDTKLHLFGRNTVLVASKGRSLKSHQKLRILFLSMLRPIVCLLPATCGATITVICRTLMLMHFG